MVAAVAYGATDARCLKRPHHLRLLEADGLWVQTEALQHPDEAADLRGLRRGERVRAGQAGLQHRFDALAIDVPQLLSDQQKAAPLSQRCGEPIDVGNQSK